MNAPIDLVAGPRDDKLQSIIKLAILAVGGQGGGVLTNWIESLARAEGYVVQATSVAGVAQRTGATIYYIEMAPAGDTEPVFSLAPTSGDVDIMIAAEMMEAGRAIMRGFVTPDRTTLIASTHRALAVSEKMVPGDGISAPEDVLEAAKLMSDRLIMFDMDQLAAENGSVISSSLFGALAASGALPFSRDAFEQAIRASGKAVDTSLRSFAAAFDRTEASESDADPVLSAPRRNNHHVAGPASVLSDWQALEAEALALPAPQMATLGLRKVVDFQDLTYGREYLDRLQQFSGHDTGDTKLCETAAKHVANAMCYDDIIRVADLKTRQGRFNRIKAEVTPGDAPINLTEFFHPRGEEIISLLPAGLGVWIEARPRLAAWIDRRVNKGRRLRTHRLRGFLTLYFLGGLRRTRRKSLRHKIEQDHLNAWQATCLEAASQNVPLAIELLKCRRLIKGYSDTHARGLSKFSRVMDAASLVADREDAPQWIERLREAALRDEHGEKLDGAIQTVRSFAD
ncbi:indolepyruvate oxidoreductase subunit beta family protein [uncultured Shimia sp.]|uniref:indolepyruvate oxidoreductase subunit beta family protein n=1 Tax=uncultured Shimia sp. TaxID=573152 RepID=UPI0026337EC4|nr:indolepyruvate oxidoreductase subunit beta family protein [uncultured Shimia sp.]